MATYGQPVKPVVGMTLAFTGSASTPLAGIPGNVIGIWPRFSSGDYLVTLEYVQPVRVGKQLIKRIDAFASELYEPANYEIAREAGQAGTNAF